MSRLNTLLLTALLALAAASSAWAISLEDAARQAARQHDAKVLSARTINRDGRRVHEIKLLTRNGVVKTVYVPEDS
ncbi:hypothetical protein F3N42_04275 [Marinihelvus fidelis]|uniref:PepSY domain-containing protein n=2 Tax=Marinihelvus fidelis TaxID=2613842 RepID=A0A5N0TG40_9GAMM|nr:hypothetical protein F3N42_04275 [Marinihelvus fidelis]